MNRVCNVLPIYPTCFCELSLILSYQVFSQRNYEGADGKSGVCNVVYASLNFNFSINKMQYLFVFDVIKEMCFNLNSKKKSSTQ